MHISTYTLESCEILLLHEDNVKATELFKAPNTRNAAIARKNELTELTEDILTVLPYNGQTGLGPESYSMGIIIQWE